MMKAKKVIGYVLLVVVSAMLLYSVWGKFFGGDMAAQMYGMLHLDKYLVVLAIAEVLSVVLLWIPKYRHAGNLLATGYLGGAVMATFALGFTPTMPGWTLVALWVGTALLSCSSAKPEKCTCKPGCTCDKGACTC